MQRYKVATNPYIIFENYIYACYVLFARLQVSTNSIEKLKMNYLHSVQFARLTMMAVSQLMVL